MWLAWLIPKSLFDVAELLHCRSCDDRICGLSANEFTHMVVFVLAPIVLNMREDRLLADASICSSD